VDELAVGLEHLAKLPDLRRQMSVPGRALVEQRMSWNSIAGRYLNLYQGHGANRAENNQV
jgi:glycosyltransferase involved in cell wall biosynthesis